MRIEEKILNEELDFDFTTAIDKMQNHISHLRLVSYSLNNTVKEQDRKIEALQVENSKKEDMIRELKKILFDIEDSIIRKINVLYQVKNQVNAIQELRFLLNKIKELKGDYK